MSDYCKDCGKEIDSCNFCSNECMINFEDGYGDWLFHKRKDEEAENGYEAVRD